MQEVMTEVQPVRTWTARDEELFIKHLFLNHGKKVDKNTENITNGIVGLATWIKTAPQRIWSRNKQKHHQIRAEVLQLVPTAQLYLKELKAA